MLFKFSSVCTFLSTTIQDDCKRRTLFRVFRGHVVFKVIFFFFCVCDNRPWHFSVVASLFCLVGTLSCHFMGRVSRIFLFSRCRERKIFFIPLQEFIVQFKTKKNLGLTSKKMLLFVFNSSKSDSGFEDILK